MCACARVCVCACVCVRVCVGVCVVHPALFALPVQPRDFGEYYLPCMDSSTTIAFQLHHDDKIPDEEPVTLQLAVL